MVKQQCEVLFVPSHRHSEFSAVMMIGIVDAPWYGVKGTWAFEVRLEYTSGRVPSYGIWCVNGMGHSGRDLAVKQILKRAEDSGGSVLMVYGVEYFSGEGAKHD